MDYEKDIEFPDEIYKQLEEKTNGLRIKSVKITPEQLDEITRHLETANYIMSGDYRLDWEDISTVHRNICDALEDLKTIRERTNAEIGF